MLTAKVLFWDDAVRAFPTRDRVAIMVSLRRHLLRVYGLTLVPTGLPRSR